MGRLARLYNDLSRPIVEPSRHALADMKKEYTGSLSGESDGSSSIGVRSRSNTVASAASQYPGSFSETSNPGSRPSSQQCSPERRILSPERPDIAARAFFTRGARVLKKHGSKINLLNLQSSEAGEDVFNDQSPTKASARSKSTGQRAGLGMRSKSAVCFSDMRD